MVAELSFGALASDGCGAFGLPFTGAFVVPDTPGVFCIVLLESVVVVLLFGFMSLAGCVVLELSVVVVVFMLFILLLSTAFGLVVSLTAGDVVALFTSVDVGFVDCVGVVMLLLLVIDESVVCEVVNVESLFCVIASIAGRAGLDVFVLTSVVVAGLVVVALTSVVVAGLDVFTSVAVAAGLVVVASVVVVVLASVVVVAGAVTAFEFAGAVVLLPIVLVVLFDGCVVVCPGCAVMVPLALLMAFMLSLSGVRNTLVTTALPSSINSDLASPDPSKVTTYASVPAALFTCVTAYSDLPYEPEALLIISCGTYDCMMGSAAGAVSAFISRAAVRPISMEFAGVVVVCPIAAKPDPNKDRARTVCFIKNTFEGLQVLLNTATYARIMPRY